MIEDCKLNIEYSNCKALIFNFSILMFNNIYIYIYIYIYTHINWGGNIVFDSNCREYSQCCLYNTSELEKNLGYKGLRQAGLIILE